LRRSSRIEEVLRCRSSSGSALRESSADKVSSGLQQHKINIHGFAILCNATLQSGVCGVHKWKNMNHRAHSHILHNKRVRVLEWHKSAVDRPGCKASVKGFRV
jgi:hypothetical protein